MVRLGLGDSSDAGADCCWVRCSFLQGHLNHRCGGDMVQGETGVHKRMWFLTARRLWYACGGTGDSRETGSFLRYPVVQVEKVIVWDPWPGPPRFVSRVFV